MFFLYDHRFLGCLFAFLFQMVSIWISYLYDSVSLRMRWCCLNPVTHSCYFQTLHLSLLLCKKYTKIMAMPQFDYNKSPLPPHSSALALSLSHSLQRSTQIDKCSATHTIFAALLPPLNQLMINCAHLNALLSFQFKWQLRKDEYFYIWGNYTNNSRLWSITNCNTIDDRNWRMCACLTMFWLMHG